MALFKCKMCGGDLEIAEGVSIAECEYCGTKQTVPKGIDENLQNLFNRANTLRIKSEFDKAEKLYEKILQGDSTQADAYWGLILCKYGIEYVDDPATYKKIPTCHRASYDSIIADDDYKSALQYADMAQRAIYEEQAREIDRIQKEILALAQNEEKYDVFICYKETDAEGKRTQDSVIANDIYYQLKQEGFKVFYAAITLEGKLGSAYEPIIFAALNSAKVMLAIGTKPEYFNAVWVKNEWSRFLKIIKQDRSKLLIPCYRDMDAYELPEEFAHLQAQDMSKIGFINDVVRGIKKVIKKDEPKATVVKETVVTTANSNVAPLLKRAYMFLEDEEWKNADEYAEKVLDIDPENAEAYLVKFLADTETTNESSIVEDFEESDYLKDNADFQKALRFADDRLRERLNGYIKTIDEENEHKRLQGIYDDAISLMNTSTVSQVLLAIEKFKSISSWKDADKQLARCETLLPQLREKEEQERIAREKKAEAERIEAERKAEAERIEAERKAKRKKTIVIASLSSAIVLIVLTILINSVFIPNFKYDKALAYIDSDDDLAAYRLLIEIQDHNDADKLIKDIKKRAVSQAEKYYYQGEALKAAQLLNEFGIESSLAKDYQYVADGKYTYVSNLDHIVIPNGTKIIPAKAFYDSNVKQVTVPNSVTSIGDNAFDRCYYLKTITMPASVKSIGKYAFQSGATVYYTGDIKSWCSIQFKNEGSNPARGGKLYINNKLVTNIVVPNDVSYISSYAFYGFNISSVTIGNSVKSIDSRAFSNCNSLTSITIPNSVTSIGEYAFGDCTSLTSVTIGEGVTSIGEGAFNGCKSLTSIVIPDSVKNIGSYAFSGCTSLRYNEYDNAYYLGNNNNFYVALIKAKDRSIKSCEIHSETKIIYYDAFGFCESLTSIEIPDSVTSIGGYAFSFCDSLASIVIPKSVTSIGFGVAYSAWITIYCEATSKPVGWHSDWNFWGYDSDCPVVWGYTGN